MRYLTASRPAGGMLRLLRTVLDRKQTGVLELSLDLGAVDLYFLSGELYLSPQEADWVPEIADLERSLNQESADIDYHQEQEAVAVAIASRMAEWNLRSFRFRDGLARVPERLAGPFSTARLAMELVSQRRKELNLEYLIGGRQPAAHDSRPYRLSEGRRRCFHPRFPYRRCRLRP